MQPRPSPWQGARRTVGVLAALLLIAVPVGARTEQQAAPPPPPAGPAQPLNMTIPQVNGTGAISGVVTDAATKKPIAGVNVYLGPPNRGPVGQPVQQVSDAKGRFVFRDLPPSEAYFINATKPGYFDGHVGQTTSTQLGARLSVKDGEWIDGVAIVMTRGAAISGTITDEHGDPVVGAYVRAMPEILIAGQPQLVSGAVTTTDDRGAYRIAGLRAGKYAIHIPNVQETVPASMTSLDLVGVTPQAAASMEAAGRPAPTPDPTMVVDAGTHLMLGRYITNPASAGPSLAYPPTFYPGVRTVAEASMIDLGSGEERAGFDIQLRPVPVSRISGTVDAPPEAIPNLRVRLLPPGAEDLGDGIEVANTLTDTSGRFAFMNVPAGSYTIDVRRSLSQFMTSDLATPTKSLPGPVGLGINVGGSSRLVAAAPTGTRISTRYAMDDTGGYSGRAKVTVDAADLTGVGVPLQRGVSMTGRVVREGPASGSDTGPAIISAEPAHGQPSLGLPSANRADPRTQTDAFRIDALQSGEYVLRLVGGGTVKSIVWDGRDYTYTPFDASAGRDFTDVVITTTTETIVLAGTVQDGKGGISTTASVLVFPVEKAQWSGYGYTPPRIKSAGVSSAGIYRFQSLPAGEYFVVAVDASQTDAWQDPKLLDALSRRATRVTLDWDGRVTQDLILK